MAEGVYETLIGFKLGTMELEPKLATDWSVSDDGLTYTFHLREGVKFHDGTTFDADDVKATFDRVMTLGVGVAFNLEGMKEVRVIDPVTVEIELEEVYAPFLGGLTDIYIYSAEAIAEHADQGELGTEWFADHAVGTGPYELESFTRGEEFVLTKFDNYWGGWEGKHIDEYIFRLVPEGSTQRMMIEAGEANMADKVPIEDLEDLAANPNVVVFEYSGIQMLYFKMNTVRGPLQEKAVRQAVDLAYDRQTYCEDLLKGHCRVDPGLIPIVMPDANPALPERQVDLDRAAQLLDEAGWTDTDGDGIRDKDGQPLKLTLMYLGPYEWQRMGGELVQANLLDIGVQLELEGEPWATMVERMNDPEARPDMAFLAVYANSPDAGSFLWPMFHCDSGHWSNFDFCDPYVDQLLEEARQTIDDDARSEVYHELEAYLMEEVASISIYVRTMFFVCTPDVKGYVFLPMDPFIPPLYNMYLEP